MWQLRYEIWNEKLYAAGEVDSIAGKMINVRWKVRFLVKDDLKVTDSVTEDKMRKGFSDQASVNIRQSPTSDQLISLVNLFDKFNSFGWVVVDYSTKWIEF